MIRLERRLAALGAAGMLISGALTLAFPDRAHGTDARVTALLATLGDDTLRLRLEACRLQPLAPTRFSIGHRGAPLQYPEHTRESYLAAIGQGAGIVECDVTVTRDHALVCRHDPCDLHRTTNILETPLTARCRQPFTPADPATGRAAAARCCAQDLTVTEFSTLCGRLDRVDPTATTVAAYIAPGMPDASITATACGTLMTHAASVALLHERETGMTPELKLPAEPHAGYHPRELTALADDLLEAYRAAGVPAAQVWPQSFDMTVVRHWLEQHPDFADQVIWLDGRYAEPGFDPSNPATWQPGMDDLRSLGLRYLAPPIPVLLALESGRIVATEYARAAHAAGLELITWTLERPGTLAGGSAFYLRPVRDALTDEGDVFLVLHALATDVGVTAVFSDWPATTTFYRNCLK